VETEGNSDGVVPQVLLEIRKMNMTEEVRMVLGIWWPASGGVAKKVGIIGTKMAGGRWSGSKTTG